MSQWDTKSSAFVLLKVGREVDFVGRYDIYENIVIMSLMNSVQHSASSSRRNSLNCCVCSVCSSKAPQTTHEYHVNYPSN